MTTKTTKTAGAPPTLQDVLNALNDDKTLSETRRRDLCSAVRRVAFLLAAETGPDHPEGPSGSEP